MLFRSFRSTSQSVLRNRSGLSVPVFSSFSVATIPPRSAGIDIFLGNIDEAVTADALKKEIVKRYNGEFAGPRIIFKERKSLGFGYITVPTTDDATKVLEQLSGLQVNNKELKIDIGQERRIFRAAFIGNLDPTVTESELQTFLEEKISKELIVKIRLSKSDAGTSRGFAHVDFKDGATRDKALIDLNGLELKG